MISYQYINVWLIIFKCQITAKPGFEAECEPSAATVKCINNRGYAFNYPKLRCERKFITV